MYDSGAVVVTVITTWTCGICGDVDSRDFKWAANAGTLELHKPNLPKGWSYCNGKAVCQRHGIIIVPPLGEEEQVEKLSPAVQRAAEVDIPRCPDFDLRDIKAGKVQPGEE